MGSASTKSNVSTSPLSMNCGGKFTREKAVDIVVYILVKYRHRLRIWARITTRMDLVRNVAGLG